MTGKSLKELEAKALSISEEARTYLVKDEETLKKAHAFLVIVRTMRKEINDTFDPIITKAHIAHKEAIAQKKKHEEPLQRAEMTVKPRIAAFMAEQIRIQREAEAKALQERIEAERKAKAEEEARFQAALKAENAGKPEEAEKIISEEPETKPLENQIVPQAPKLEGTSVKRIWKWRVVNLALVPRPLLMIDSAKVTDQVRKHKDQTEIPGIQIYQESILSTTLKKEDK